MPVDVSYLEGKSICAVFCKVVNPDAPSDSEKFQIRCLHGRANTEGNYLTIESGNGNAFKVPPSAYHQVFPNDGTDILKDAEYFIMIKVSSNMNL